ncbi:MAG: hypothetical protein KDC39_15865 [Actinobacteria bacterium]|nr:hypothetical protein [Actinomycetota bacterium]
MAGRRGNGEGSIYKRKDGRWVASWTERTADGTKRRTAYAATQKAAKDKLKQAVRRMDDGLPSVD